MQLIIAPSLLSSLSTPAFLIDVDGNALLFNDPAGAMLGRRHEETGRMPVGDRTSTFGPFADDGRPIPFDELPLTAALRANRPPHAGLRIRSTTGVEHGIEAGAPPSVGERNFDGAMVVFWPVGEAPLGGAA